jgi:hypothetical protein
VFNEDELEGALPARFSGPELRQLKGNKMERYHHFPAALAQGHQLQSMFLDFKRCLGIPPETLYESIEAQQIVRVATIPPVFLQDLTHRLYGYLSRVGPDFQ